MSTVVKMLTGEKDVDDNQITKPGLISDFMDLKVRAKQKSTSDMRTSCTASSSLDNQDTTMSSVTSTAATTTFTAQYD